MDSDFEILNNNMRIEGCCFEKSFTFLSGHTVPIYKIDNTSAFNQLVGYAKFKNAGYGNVYYRGISNLYDNVRPAIMRGRTKGIPDDLNAICETILEVLDGTGIYLAAQCCEHLNRAIIVEKQYAKENRIPIVNVVPQLKAGGSFATATYKHLKEPVAVEEIQAAAGIDIGDTLIGMHLRPVAVPVRGSIDSIGNAHTVMARTRAKFIGGERAVYYKP